MIPVNVITGFLGTGKTTAIRNLLQDAKERWAVLISEPGDVSIDPSLPNVTVREVGGGCLCCSTAPFLQFALHLLLIESQPTRLLIESTGHPGRLIDTLREHYADRLEVRPTLGLVVPQDIALDNPVFRQQVERSEILILNKLDRAKPGDVERFQEWATKLLPPKLLIVATEQGRIDPAWLDLVTSSTALSSP